MERKEVGSKGGRASGDSGSQRNRRDRVLDTEALPEDAKRWVEGYREVTEILTELRGRVPGLAFFGTSLLHPRHPLPDEHKALVDAYLGLDEESPGRKPNSYSHLFSLGRILQSWRSCLRFAMRDTYELVRLKIASRARVRAASGGQADLVLKSWWFGRGQMRGRDDFYLGDLPARVVDRGLRPVVLYGSLGPGAAEAPPRDSIGEGVPYVPERALLPLWAPLRLAAAQLPAALRLRRVSREAEVSGEARLAVVAAAACSSCLRPSTIRSAGYYYIGREAVRRWSPRAFVTLYEGQPWERLIWKGARAVDPDCAVAGFQHTVVMPHSLCVLAPPRNGTDPPGPDVALCVGEATREMMRPGHSDSGTRLVRFGSVRERPRGTKEAGPRPERRTVLVLPEGVRAEALTLFNFALRAAARLPGHDFLFRSHPALPFEEVAGDLEGTPEEFSNVELSRRSLISDDFARSSVVLYRGTSAVLYGVLHGMKPVYLHMENRPFVDPLFRLRRWREVVATEKGFAEVASRYALESGDAARDAWSEARKYVDKYTDAVDEAALDRFLSAAGFDRAAAASG